MRHAASAMRVYRKRSWRRLGRPCQNSISAGDDAVAAPVRRARDVATLEARGDGGELRLEMRAVRDDRGLLRRPRAELAAARTRAKVGLGLLAGRLLRRADDLQLPLEQDPEEVRGDAGILGDRVPLRALVVREEREAALVEPLQEDDARGGRAGRTDRRHRHRGGLGVLRGDRLVEPGLCLHER